MLLTIIFLLLILINPYITRTINVIVTISIIIKLGAAPFHKWIPDIIAKIRWNKCILLITWQKVAPLMIIRNLFRRNLLINLSIIWSIGIGRLGGINQSSLRKIIAYSSINHLGWLIAINKSINLWIVYMIIYRLLISIICKIFNKYKMYFINQISSLNLTLTEKINIFIIIIRIGGLPPFIGFLPKWITIQRIVANKEFIITSIIIIFRLITLIYYIRIITRIFLTQRTSIKWITFNNKKTTTYTIIINILLPAIIIIDIL